MPPIASEVQPHPRSLNNISLSNLLRETRAQSVSKFLASELSGVSTAIANKISTKLGFDNISPKSLPTSKVAALCQILRDDKSQIRPPLSTCLSPAGEYNMRLGVLKEMCPRLVTTFTDKSGAHEGHPFLVEAAVSIGGPKVREGINVYRFANRIPLLFETGADVVTQVATKRINWSSYHIDSKKDNVGIFVSIVATKIPFKGTSKEYVGDDVIELQHSVKRAIIGCCQQLRVSLALNIKKKEQQERKNTLLKYIPDISHALMVILDKVEDKEYNSNTDKYITSDKGPSGLKRSRLLRDVAEEKLSEFSLSSRLRQSVENFDADTALQQAIAFDEASGGGNSKKIKMYLIPDDAMNKFPLPNSSSSVNIDDIDISNLNNSKYISESSEKSKWLTLSSGLNAMIFVKDL
jgi:DNA topoisomerase VI subunit B